MGDMDENDLPKAMNIKIACLYNQSFFCCAAAVSYKRVDSFFFVINRQVAVFLIHE